MMLRDRGGQMIAGFERPNVIWIRDRSGRVVGRLLGGVVTREFRPNASHAVTFYCDVFARILRQADVLELVDLNSADHLLFDCKARGWWHLVTLPVGDRIYVDLTAWAEFVPGLP